MGDTTLPQLNRSFAITHQLISTTAHQRPIKVIQFGEGNFLRAFVDWTIQQMNNAHIFNGNVAVVQPIGQGRIQELAKQDYLYTVVLEGIQGGRQVQSHEVIDSIATGVSVNTQWQEYLALAENPDTQIIISNTTEAGIALDTQDNGQQVPPASFPSKLLHLLKRRFDKGLPGFLIVPCELIANNGDTLKQYLLTLVQQFGWPEEFAQWIEHDNIFVNTLVDRIVPGYPADRAVELEQEYGYIDRNMVKAEPFLLWVIAGDEQARNRVHELLPAAQLGIDLVTPESEVPYRERKVYLLNAPHTTLASVARLAGVQTVGQAMHDTEIRAFIEREMQEEIIPVLSLDREELEGFAAAVLERYDNPFVQHKLDAIGLNSVAKYAARCLPILEADIEQGRGLPERLVLALAGILVNYGKLAGNVNVTDDPKIVEVFAQAQGSDFVNQVLSNTELWGKDLTQIDGLVDLVNRDVDEIVHGNIRSLINKLS